jgi:hypothetical protein
MWFLFNAEIMLFYITMIFFQAMTVMLVKIWQMCLLEIPHQEVLAVLAAVADVNIARRNSHDQK